MSRQDTHTEEAPIVLDTVNKRMLELMRYCIATSLADIRSESDFCELVGFDRHNLPKLKKGLRSFTKEHLEQAGRRLQVNMNWIFGFEEEMIPQLKSQTKFRGSTKRAI